jgi:hypothetical protein
MLGIKGDMIVLSAGRYHQTEKICATTVECSYWSRPERCRQPQSRTGMPVGIGEILDTGDVVDAVKTKFSWARGAMVIGVESAHAQL